MKKVTKKKVFRKNEINERSVYITEGQNKYLLDKSVQLFGQSNKKSEVLRDLLEFAMESDPVISGLKYNTPNACEIYNKGGEEK